MLEMRLIELEDVVDFFVLVEAELTHSGEAKELVWHDRLRHEKRFERFLPKILAHVVRQEQMKGAPSWNSWDREAAQRNAISDAIIDAVAVGYEPSDLVVLSDVDEIPRKSAVHALTQCPDRYRFTPCAIFQTRFHQYNLNWAKQDEQARKWRAPHVVRASTILPNFSSRGLQNAKGIASPTAIRLLCSGRMFEGRDTNLVERPDNLILNAPSVVADAPGRYVMTGMI